MKPRSALAALGALAAIFSLSACDGDAATDGRPVTGSTNSVGGYSVSEVTSPYQPNAVIVSYSGYKSGGVAIVSTIGAEPTSASRVLREYSFDGNSFMEFNPAADRNTVCTLVEGYHSGGLTCVRSNPAAPVATATPATTTAAATVAKPAR